MSTLRQTFKNYYLYRITNLRNGKIYIGVHQTYNLNDGYMGSGKLLKSDYRKYGKECFRKEILEFFSNQEDMYMREYEVVNEDFISRSDVYNMSLGGGGTRMVGRPAWNKGKHPSEESRRKMSEAHKGKVAWNKWKKGVQSMSEETRRKMSEAHKGRVVSEESRKKQSASLKARNLLHPRVGVNAAHYGKKHNAETKLKISQANKGRLSSLKGRHISNETKMKISKAMKGRPSPMKGKHHSDETKQKISETKKMRGVK